VLSAIVLLAQELENGAHHRGEGDVFGAARPALVEADVRDALKNDALAGTLGVVRHGSFLSLCGAPRRRFTEGLSQFRQLIWAVFFFSWLSLSLG
jgi:hypothetical protein